MPTEHRAQIRPMEGPAIHIEIRQADNGWIVSAFDKKVRTAEAVATTHEDVLGLVNGYLGAFE